MDMLKKFTENDIVDIFQGATFADRFQLRQFLFGNNKNSATITPANNTPAKNKQSDLRRFCQPELPSGSAHGSQQSNVELETTATSTPTTPSSSCKRTYNVMDMFRTKERRGTPSKEQKFFQSLLRDAASSCGLWKRPPRMSQISAKRKELFFKTILEACPDLTSYKKEVWAKLRACLQNRRKYIHDRDAGKRKLKSDDTSVGSSKLKTDAKTDDIIEGNTVALYGRDKRVLGKAIFLQKRDDTYSEIVIQSLSKNIEGDSNDTDCELPEVADGHTTLCNALIRKKVIWKTKRLMCTEKQAPVTTKTSKPKASAAVKSRVRKRKLPSFEEDDSTLSTASTSDIDSDVSSIISSTSDLDVQSSASPVHVMDDVIINSNENENPTKGKKVKKVSKCSNQANNGNASGTRGYSVNRKLGAKKFDSDNVDDEKLCIYEWSGGNFYFGVSYTYLNNCTNVNPGSTVSGKRQLKIINCSKPIASMDNGVVEVINPCKCASTLKLNFSDIQSDPNPVYKVYEVSDALREINFEEKTVTLLGNINFTMKNVRKAIMSYIDLEN